MNNEKLHPYKPLIDPYHRQLNYLRISITDRCNLRCMYCVPRELIPWLSHDEILRYEEILRVARIASRLGISKLRITGGEPLVRKGVFDFLAQLTQLEGLEDVALTTNGMVLQKNLARLWSAGIRRINVSLDTLNPRKFKHITGSDKFHQVWQAIQLAGEMGFHPIKINVVALRGINDDELVDLARLSLSTPLHVRFIEYMPIGHPRIRNGPPLLLSEIRERIESLGELVPVKKASLDGPAQRFAFKGAQGEIGFIGALSHHFCRDCNRLRLTAKGGLRPCLLSDTEFDLKAPLRAGASDVQLVQVFLKAAHAKPMRHHLSCQHPKGVCGQMSAIGG